MRRLLAFTFITAALTLLPLSAGEQKTPAKLKALLITGGGYHDYKKLNPVITKKISELANVSFELRSGLETLKNPKFADGFDVVIYNFCFAKDSDKAMIENALKVTRDGKPSVLVHCAMHTFMASDEWTDCCGMRTRVHDPFRAFAVIKADKTHPIVLHLPDNWPTAGDELYQTIKLGERSTALYKGKAQFKNKAGKTGFSEHTVAWVSTYGKGKVFATTLGHDLRTVNLPEYHQLLANGLLWACGKLDDQGKALPGYGK